MKGFLVKFFAAFLCAATVFADANAISRVIPGKGGDANTTNEKVESGTSANVNRATASRNVARKNTSGNTNATNNTTQQNTISRSVNNRKTVGTVTAADAANVVGRSARTESASINNTPAMRRAGIILRASTAEVGGRATIGNTDIQTGSNID